MRFELFVGPQDIHKELEKISEFLENRKETIL